MQSDAHSLSSSRVELPTNEQARNALLAEFRSRIGHLVEGLRGIDADQALDVTEEDRRREIAREWEQLQRRIEIVGFAIREWDFLAPTTERSEARS